jgi:hypothetical protein
MAFPGYPWSIYTENGYRILNNPEVSGVSNTDLQKALDNSIRRSGLAYRCCIGPSQARSGMVLTHPGSRNTHGEKYIGQLTEDRDPSPPCTWIYTAFVTVHTGRLQMRTSPGD